jgi:hypothetical protein
VWSHGEGEGILDAGKGPHVLLGADEDSHPKLLLLGELGRHDER